MGYIYLLTSPSGKHYVGQTIRTIEIRWKQHVYEAESDDYQRGCQALNNAIRKYGANNFQIESLGDYLDEELDDMEQLYIIFMESHHTVGGYNITRGGKDTSHIFISTEKRQKNGSKTRIHKTYELPMHVVEIHDKGTGANGFMVIAKDKRYSFTSMNMTMEQKYHKAMECYDSIITTGVYVRKNVRKKGDDELDIPMYIVRCGKHGFAINKPGIPRKNFIFINNTREENLALAIKYLNSLN